MKIHLTRTATALAVLGTAGALGCGGDEEPRNPMGQAGSNAGTSTTGGTGGALGGTTNAGSASGGMTVGGPASGTGGGLGHGGAGSPGGSANGGSMGGSSAPSGGTSAGGKSGGGSGAAGTAGSGSGGGSGATPSKGCGGTATPMACSTSGSPCKLDVSGTERKFYVVLPSNYSAARPYPVVFQFHPLGGNAEQGMNMYNVRPNFPDAIYITPQGLGDQPGWANTNGQDVAFTRAMMADAEAKYCVDTSRYFSTGFSYGGIMSFTIACQMADVFRAIAPMAGFQFGMEAACKPARPIAAWISQGAADTVVDPDGAAALKDILVKTNHCQATSSPVDPSPCVAYAGCDAGYPVTWCLVDGQGHAIPNYSPKAIAAFFKQL